MGDIPGGRLGEPDGNVLGIRVGDTEGTVDGEMIGAWEGLLEILGLLVPGAGVGTGVGLFVAPPRAIITSKS